MWGVVVAAGAVGGGGGQPGGGRGRVFQAAASGEHPLRQPPGHAGAAQTPLPRPRHRLPRGALRRPACRTLPFHASQIAPGVVGHQEGRHHAPSLPAEATRCHQQARGSQAYAGGKVQLPSAPHTAPHEPE